MKIYWFNSCRGYLNKKQKQNKNGWVINNNLLHAVFMDAHETNAEQTGSADWAVLQK